MVFFVELVTALVTGSSLDQDLVEMEIIEDSGVTRVCPQALNYPIYVQQAAGSLLPDNTILICGGQQPGSNQHECYTLKNSKWEEGGNLLTERTSYASSTIGNGKGTYI